MAHGDGIQYFAKTDVGRVREHNEDNYLVDRKLGLAVVCDGMGGHAAGEIASAISVRVVQQEMRRKAELIEDVAAGRAPRAAGREIQRALEAAVHRACARVFEESKADPSKRGMGTTLSAIVVAGSQGYIAHVGDSRIYHYRAGKIEQLTFDHTVYNELVRRGTMPIEEIEKMAQKNAVSRAVGVFESVEVECYTVDLKTGDQLILASDGLHGYIHHPSEFEAYFEDESGDRATDELIQLANQKGGKDNITCVLMRLVPPRADDLERMAARSREQARRRERLARAPLFARLDDRELLNLLHSCDVLQFEEGEEVVHEGDRGDQMFIVIDGELTVWAGEHEVGRVGAGEHFGEMALLRGSPRSATVRAKVRTEVCALKRGDLFAFVRDEPAIAVRWLWPLLGILADRLDTSSRALSRAREELEAEDISDVIDAEEENSGRSSNPPTVRISAETSEALAAGSMGVDSGDLEELDVEADGAPTQARPVVNPSEARRGDDAPESSAPTVGRPILAPTRAETVISVAGTSPTPKDDDGADEGQAGAPAGDSPLSEASTPDPATDPSGGAPRPRRMLSVTLPSSAFRDALLASDEKPKT